MMKSKSLLLHGIMMLYVFLTLVPLVWIVLSAFKTNVEIMTKPLGLPTGFHLENFRNTWTSANIGTYFFNSLFVSMSATLITLLFASATSFALTRMHQPKMNKLFTGLLLLGLTVPAGSLLVPLYFLVVRLHIYDTHLALILPYITFGLPFSVFVIMAFMKSIPKEMEEAAVIDGSHVFGIFCRIILPLTIPVLVTAFILTYISNWNEFVMANFYIEDVNIRTLPVGMVAFRDAYRTNFSGIAVGVIYSVLPVLVIYGILQEKIIAGMTAGSIKG